MRDVFLTLRSFVRRVSAFVGYRRATRDMNERYPDALPEEVAREEVCIICREEMRARPPAGQAQDGPAPGGGDARGVGDASLNERSRPKRLPCGHILHFGCLRRWLARQQICPTCRRPVMSNGPITGGTAGQFGGAQVPQAPAGQAGLPQQLPGGAAPAPAGGAQAGQPANRARVFNLGPLRIGFGVGTGQVFQDVVQRMQNGPNGQPRNEQPDQPNRAQVTFGFGFGRPAGPAIAPATDHQTANVTFAQAPIDVQLQQLEQQLQLQITSLRATANQLRLVQALSSELTRLRQVQAALNGAVPGTMALGPTNPANAQQAPAVPTPNFVPYTTRPLPNDGLPLLPSGVTLPPGWRLIPVRPMNAAANGPQPRTEASPGPSDPPASQATAFGASGIVQSDAQRGNHFQAPVQQASQDPSSATAPEISSTDATRSSTGPGRDGLTETSSIGDAPTTESIQMPGPSQPPFDSQGLPSPTEASIPQWSSAESVPFLASASTSENRPNGVPTHASLSTNSTLEGKASTSSSSAAPDVTAPPSVTQSDKGKGRAATVEESTDEPD